jgi:signal transduction histidine kinase
VSAAAAPCEPSTAMAALLRLAAEAGAGAPVDQWVPTALEALAAALASDRLAVLLRGPILNADFGLHSPTIDLARRLVDHPALTIARPCLLERDPCLDGERLAPEMVEAGISGAFVFPATAGTRGLVLVGDDAAWTESARHTLTLVATTLMQACRFTAESRELQSVRDAAARNERLSTIGAMTASIAHEIRNPLVSVRTFTQLLPERANDEEFRGEFLDLTLSEIDRVCELVGELLDYSRPYGLDTVGADVVECLRSVQLLLASQAKAGGVRLLADVAEFLPDVAVAPDRLKQVLINLAMNAIQACRGSGNVSLHARATPQGLLVEVRDDGCGMDESTRARIFDAFYTTRREGTGLGLAIARRIIEEAGGRLEAESAPGQGTTFRLHLPTSAPAGVVCRA